MGQRQCTYLLLNWRDTITPYRESRTVLEKLFDGLPQKNFREIRPNSFKQSSCWHQVLTEPWEVMNPGTLNLAQWAKPVARISRQNPCHAWRLNFKFGIVGFWFPGEKLELVISKTFSWECLKIRMLETCLFD